MWNWVSKTSNRKSPIAQQENSACILCLVFFVCLPLMFPSPYVVSVLSCGWEMYNIKRVWHLTDLLISFFNEFVIFATLRHIWRAHLPSSHQIHTRVALLWAALQRSGVDLRDYLDVSKVTLLNKRDEGFRMQNSCSSSKWELNPHKIKWFLLILLIV